MLSFPAFVEEVKEAAGKHVHEFIASSFTTTDAMARACSDISIMPTTKHYLLWGLMTMCGQHSVGHPAWDR